VNVRIVVRAGEAGPIGDVLSRHGVASSALADGRVFAAGRRVEDARKVVQSGDEIVVEDARKVVHGGDEGVEDARRVAQGGDEGVEDARRVAHGNDEIVEDARRPSNRVEIISEHLGLYAVSKPPGLPTEPDRSGTASVVFSVADLLGVPAATLHAATRLDVPVSGVVVVARGRDATRLAASLKAHGDLRRRYVALAARAVEPRAGVWDTPLPDSTPRRVPKAAARSRGSASGRGHAGAAPRPTSGTRAAVSRYAFVASAKPLPSAPAPALLAVEPITGRTHQIRLHASLAGAPLLGDAKYGGPRRLVLPDGRVLVVPRVALHAGRVEVRRAGVVEWTATAPFPEDLAMLWSALGGDEAAVTRALQGSPLAER